MAMTADEVLPWGRSLEEYRLMFDLSGAELGARILGCGDGPASFNSEMAALGYTVVSCDPIYAFSAAQIEQRVNDTYATIIGQVQQTPEHYVWEYFRDAGELGQHRLATMRRFLADFAAGKATGRYRTGQLPALQFADRQFDLALCSHLLFLYSEQLSLAFHQAAIRELCRVAHEVRIFPLLALDCNRSPHIEPVRSDCAAAGLTVEIVAVPYEFQRGGNQMMRIYRNEDQL